MNLQPYVIQADQKFSFTDQFVAHKLKAHVTKFSAKNLRTNLFFYSSKVQEQIVYISENILQNV